jgi:hypothetical protein
MQVCWHLRNWYEFAVDLLSGCLLGPIILTDCQYLISQPHSDFHLIWAH